MAHGGSCLGRNLDTTSTIYHLLQQLLTYNYHPHYYYYYYYNYNYYYYYHY